jgi:hypothetical protein
MRFTVLAWLAIGCGGGGGLIILVHGGRTDSGTITAAGGAVDTNVGTAAGGTAGTAGIITEAVI